MFTRSSSYGMFIAVATRGILIRRLQPRGLGDGGPESSGNRAPSPDSGSGDAQKLKQFADICFKYFDCRNGQNVNTVILHNPPPAFDQHVSRHVLYVLPDRLSRLADTNFTVRMLFYEAY